MNSKIERAKAYSAIKHKITIAEWFVSLVFFAGLWLSSASAVMESIASGVSSSYFVSILIYLFIIGSLLQVILFPLDYASSFKAERAFGLLRQSFNSWLKDYFKKSVFSGILYAIMVLVLYFFLRASRQYWWIYAPVTYFLINIFLARFFPQIIIPLFYKLTKIDDAALKNRLILLADSMGIKVLDVYNIGLGAKTAKANAAICGLGTTKKILLSDTLIEKYTPEEIEAALAHELSHHKRHHFWKLSIWNFAFLTLNFLIIKFILEACILHSAISSVFDVKAFPLIAISFLAYNILSLPVLNLISRIYESQADRDAVLTTRKPRVFAGLLEKLSAQNLSDPSPGTLSKALFYNHPPAQERISAVNSLPQK